MAINQDEKKQLKGRGILACRDGEHFAVRVITRNGVMTAAQMDAVSAASKTYGSGTFCFTTRLTVEIMDVPYQNVEPLVKALAAAGLQTGGTGPKVRPVVACKGTYCVFGLADTQGVAEKMHERFYEGYRAVTLPHKFKIAVGGCPNNCVKPDLNDVGLIGALKPVVKTDVCRGCKKCLVETVCHPQAAAVTGGKMRIDESKCVTCGKCYYKCPFKAIDTDRRGFKIAIGGRWGKVSRKGDMLDGVFTEGEALDMTEKVLLLFKKYAFAGERLGAMIDRMGIDRVKAILAGEEDLLAEKAEILAMPVSVRG